MTTRRPLIAGNWKMNGLAASVENFRQIVAGAKKLREKVDFIVCPPATLIFQFVGKKRRWRRVRIRKQNRHRLDPRNRARGLGESAFDHRRYAGPRQRGRELAVGAVGDDEDRARQRHLNQLALNASLTYGTPVNVSSMGCSSPRRWGRDRCRRSPSPLWGPVGALTT